VKVWEDILALPLMGTLLLYCHIIPDFLLTAIVLNVYYRECNCFKGGN
jgi:hypothetical protein